MLSDKNKKRQLARFLKELIGMKSYDSLEYLDLPDLCKHVIAFLPFGRFFSGEKAQVLHIWKIQVYIINNQ